MRILRRLRRTSRARLASLLLVLLGAGACGEGGRTARQEETAQAAGGAPIVPVTAAGLHSRVREAGDGAVLVNVWATWCVPCREEFPDLVRLHRELSGEGFDLLLVSADFDTEIEEVRAFLADQGVDFETYQKHENDMQFIDGMNPEWSGALPASFLYDGSGTLRRFWQGRAAYEELRAEILSLLEPEGSNPSPQSGGIGS